MAKRNDHPWALPAFHKIHSIFIVFVGRGRLSALAYSRSRCCAASTAPSPRASGSRTPAPTPPRTGRRSSTLSPAPCDRCAGVSSSVAAGGAAPLLPIQWRTRTHLRTIPDTVDDCTGCSIGLGLWVWTVAGVDCGEYRPNGHAHVRYVTLPPAATTSSSRSPRICRTTRRSGRGSKPKRRTLCRLGPTRGFGSQPALGRRRLAQRQEALVHRAQRLIRARRVALGGS
jgi:hypothetical protein